MPVVFCELFHAGAAAKRPGVLQLIIETNDVSDMSRRQGSSEKDPGGLSVSEEADSVENSPVASDMKPQNEQKVIVGCEEQTDKALIYAFVYSSVNGWRVQWAAD